MRAAHNFLLVVGATALGTCAFCLALYCYAEATGLGRHHGPSDLGAAGLGILLAIGSAALGAIAGFVASVWWISKHESKPWPRRIWFGVILGMVTGAVLHFASRLPRVPTLIEMLEYRPAAAVLTAALGMLGGMFAKFIGPRPLRPDARQQHPKPPP